MKIEDIGKAVGTNKTRERLIGEARAMLGSGVFSVGHQKQSIDCSKYTSLPLVSALFRDVWESLRTYFEASIGAVEAEMREIGLEFTPYRLPEDPEQQWEEQA